jgi:enterobactin synthetase component F
MSIVSRHEKIIPVSLAQAGMWVKQKVAPADLSFVLAEALEIHGKVDVDCFRRALYRLSEEAAVTRANICEVDGLPHQVIHATYVGSFEVVDLSEKDDPRAAADVWMQAELRQPLDMAKDILWLSALLKLSDDHWIWYHRVHHILMDGFSGGILARRMAEIYTAFLAGEQLEFCDLGSPQELLDLEKAYRDSTHFQKDRAYWSEQLKALPPPVTLAKRKVEPSGGLLRHTASLDRDGVKSLQMMSKSLGASVPQTLIALVAAYYARATDCEELTMITMVTARLSQASRRIPGMMANAVPLRFSMAPDLTLRELMKQVSQQMTRALRYQRYRYEDMRRDLALVRPDAQIAWLGVNIEPFDYDLRFGGHPATVHNLSNGTMTDFTIFAYDRGDNGDLRIDFDANPALYSAEELADHEERFMRLLAAATAAPDMPLREISLLSAAERDAVLTQWNKTERFVPDLTWPQLFRQQAARTPDAIALSSDEGSMTYGQLDAESDHLAGYLLEQGVTAGTLVAVAMPRCARLVVALMATMKAGAAYLPLDPADPSSRVSMILDDARPAAVITTQEVALNLPQSDLNLVFLDKPFERSSDVIPHGPTMDDTAYIIFTSGSTGRPKGVQIPHGALVNFLFAMQDLLKLSEADRLLAVTTISFDIAALELYLPLLVGARAVVAQRSTVRDPAALCRLIKKSGVSVMQATPSLWRALLVDHQDELIGLRSLVGGEALPSDLAHKMASLGHPVLNVYGPTETTVWSTAMPLTGNDLDTSPIGRPIWNTRVYVLDRNSQPVPPGFIGELYIGGAGVAQGYLNRPDLTKERFLPDPFVGGNERIYRTGDLARWRNDGALEYMGRNDHQIKIRGFRVEPGEIETVLTAMPEILEAVVILREDDERDKRLVAYIVPEKGLEVEASDLSRRLGLVLPSHMVPAAFVVLDAIPLNGNGKTDRHALPKPQWDVTEGYVAPSTETEKWLAGLWSKLLGVEKVGVHDSFFALGGDSLAAVGMISAMRNKFKGEIPLASVFESPTIAALSSLLDEARAGNSLVEPVLTIRSKGSRPPLFCIHPVLGLGWGFFSLAKYLGDDAPIYALQSDGLRSGDLPNSIEDMASIYIERVRKIQPHGPYHFLGWSLGGLIAHEMTRQLRDSDEIVSFLGVLDSYPFKTDNVGQDDVSRARAALGFLGYDENAAGENPSLSDLGDFVYSMFDSENHALLEQVRQYDPDFIARTQKTILYNLELAQRFVPGWIDVDMHFFNAEQKTGGASIRNILNYDAEAWLPHVDGRIYVRHLNCTHHDMLNADMAAEISSAVQAEILREFLVLRQPSAKRLLKMA